MSRAFGFSLLIVGLIAGGAVGAPVISVDSPTFTATVQSGSQVVHEFRLTNTGDAPLSITGVQASCGCTATTLEKSQLAPGESEVLEARVNTAGFSGTVQKTVNVQSNDPATPTLALRLTLTIVDEVKPRPVSVTAPSTQTAPKPPAPGRTPPALEWWPLAAVGACGIIVGYALALLVRQTRRPKKPQ